ncbi:MAG: EamA family transporter [Calothrix sp. C42_A2020_038]|nr:EamA family transporter [Calothrix sp. C42_A2020_038]
MNLEEFGLLLLSVLSSVAGQFFLKMGATKLSKASLANVLNQVISMITIPELLIGLSFYGLGAIAYILVLRRVNLSVAGPSASLVYVFSVLIGLFVFKEPIPLVRLLGLGFIVCGVILVVWHK